MISGPVEVYTFLKQKEEWVCNGGEIRYIFSKSSNHRRSAETEDGAWYLWMASTRSSARRDLPLKLHVQEMYTVAGEMSICWD